MIECPICIEIISEESQDYINLECCNKLVHISCLKDWCASNRNRNINKRICILCRKESEILCDFLNNLNQNSERSLESEISENGRERRDNMTESEIREVEFPRPLLISKCIMNVCSCIICLTVFIFFIYYVKSN